MLLLALLNRRTPGRAVRMTVKADSRAASGAPANRYLAMLRKAARGPQIAALFDFDGTIIAGYSATGVLREKFTRGQMSAAEIIGTAAAMTRYWRGRIGFSGLMTAGARFMRGVSEESFAQLGEDLYLKRIAGRIYPETRALIRAHQAKGHTVAIVSSATLYQIAPAARDLDIDRILCSQYEIAERRIHRQHRATAVLWPGQAHRGGVARRRTRASISTGAISIPTATTTWNCSSESATRGR